MNNSAVSTIEKAWDERELLERLKGGAVTLPPLRLRLVTEEAAPTRGTLGAQADGVLDVEWQNRCSRYVFEYKRLSTPKSVETALMQVRSYAQTSKLLPMVIVPFLSEKSLEMLEREGVSGIDLSGNGLVVAPHFSVLRTGQPNRFRDSQPIRNVFRGNSSLLARCFLLQREFSSLKDLRTFALERLMERGDIAKDNLLSKGTVSKVVQALVEEAIVVQMAQTVRLAAPELLLERLRANYAVLRGQRMEGKMPLAVSEAWTRLQESGLRYIATGDGSAGRYRLLSSGEKLSLYVDNLQEAASVLEVKESRIFPNVELVATESDSFYFDARSESAIRWASPIQTWLELSHAGPREREAAQSLEIALVKGEAASPL